MSRVRTDCHRPSVLVSDDYDYVCSYYHKIKFVDQLEAFRLHRDRTNGKFADINQGLCDICGTAFLSYSIYHHPKTNEYIRIGEICASKIDQQIFDRLKTEERSLLIRAGKGKCKALLTENQINPDQVYEVINDSNNVILARKPIALLTSVIGTVEKSGKLSEKQVSFINNLLNQIIAASQKETELKQNAVNIPEWEEGRQTIQATVFKSSWTESDFGLQNKLMAKTELGQVVMFNCPSSFDGDDLVNSKVEVTLTLQPTQDKITGKQTFAFGKRPSKLKVIAE